LGTFLTLVPPLVFAGEDFTYNINRSSFTLEKHR
jgi:hypothetical protein